MRVWVSHKLPPVNSPRFRRRFAPVFPHLFDFALFLTRDLPPLEPGRPCSGPGLNQTPRWLERGGGSVIPLFTKRFRPVAGVVAGGWKAMPHGEGLGRGWLPVEGI